MENVFDSFFSIGSSSIMEIGSSAYRERRDSIASSMLSGGSRSISGRGVGSVFAFGYNAVKNRAFFVVQFAVPLSGGSRLAAARKGSVGGCRGGSLRRQRLSLTGR